MVNPGSFQGTRKEFLLSEKPNYAAGVEGGYAADALTEIQRRYFKRYPVDLPHDEEPTLEHLNAVDDDTPEPEQEAPDIDSLGEEGFAAAMKEIKTRRALVTFRKAQIKRWLAYQFMKDHDLDPKDSGASNPYQILLHQLTGAKVPRPRLKTPANVWRKTQRGIIDQEVARRLDIFSSSGSRRRDLVSTRDKVAREMYAQLPEVEKEEWVERAKEEHEAALEAWKVELKKKPSTEPEARQRCIQGLTRFVQPILNSIVEATGWKVSLLAGGPEPADDGRLNIISIHSGTTPGDVPMNFGCAERMRYKKYIVPAFGSFLQKCYSTLPKLTAFLVAIEECRARALPKTEGFPSLATLDLDDEGVNYDRVIAAESLSTALSGNISRENYTIPRKEPSNPPGIPLRATTPLNPPPAFLENSYLHRPSSQQILPRQPPAPRFSPAIPSCPASPIHSGADDWPPSSTVPSPPRSSSEDTSTVSSSSHTAFSPPTLPHQSNTVPDRPSPTDLSAPPVSSSEGAAAQSSSLNSPPTLASQHRATSAQPQHTNVPSISSSHDPVVANAASDHTPSSGTAANSSSSQERPEGYQQPISHPVKRVRQDPTDKDNTAGPSTKRPRTVSTTFSSNQRRLLRSTTYTPPTLPLSTSSTRLPELGSHLPAPNVEDSSSLLPSSEDTRLPDWFRSAKSMFEYEPLGARWLELVGLWSLFEKQEEYTGSTYLPSKNRPESVAQWIKRKRSPTWRPTINLTSYEEDIRLWWTSLQPTWRVVDDAIVLANIEGDWGVLRKAGVNGVVSVLAALLFWGCHIIDVSEDQDMWDLIVRDCIHALSHLVNNRNS